MDHVGIVDEDNDRPTCSEDGSDHSKPFVGMLFDSIEEAWEVWRNYGKKAGFGVRKDNMHKRKKDGTISDAKFVCNKEGYKGFDKRRVNSEHRWETRTGCLAKLYVVNDMESGKYMVKNFVDTHNHELDTPDTIHMLRSHRSVTEAQGCAISVAANAGLTPSEAYALQVVEAGGRQNVGYVLEDHKTYLRTRRQHNMKYGHLGAILRYFKEKKLQWPGFYHSEQQDVDEKITNIFWCDVKMQADYEIFGDVVIFDTTYGTNKEFRPVGVFVGFNNHRQMIIFGAALMYDETIDSFKWLFETFVAAHKNKQPKTIFTDQDQAMLSALQQVLPGVYHGLCTWHITKNAKKHLTCHLQGKPNFWGYFQSCMYHIVDELKFEETWMKMLEEFGLQQNAWLSGIYQLRKKWAKCFMKNTFTAGIRSTQLSESLNSDLKKHMKCDMHLSDFFKQFDRVIERKRSNENEAEFKARQKSPSLMRVPSPLCQQVAYCYTPAIYSLFQIEFDSAAGFSCRTENESQNTFIVVAHMGNQREYRVFCDRQMGDVTCSCQKWEMTGIFCAHILTVLYRQNIVKIPEKYILARWTREARSLVTPLRELGSDDVSQWVTRITSMVLRATYHAAPSSEARTKLTDWCTDMCSRLYALSLDRSCNQVRDDDSEDAHDVGKGLARRTGKKKTKRYKSVMELRAGKGRRTKVTQKTSNLRPTNDNGPSMLSPQASNNNEGRHMQTLNLHPTNDSGPSLLSTQTSNNSEAQHKLTLPDLNQMSNGECLGFDYHIQSGNNIFGWQ